MAYNARHVTPIRKHSRALRFFHERTQAPDSRFDEAQALGVIGGIARANKFKTLAVGAMPDHVHVLLSLPATLTVAKALQLIKGGSSKWMNDHSQERTFAWQDSYGAFSIGISQVDDTVRYINTQEEHHAKLTFDEEFKQFLKRHGIAEFRG